MSGAPGNAARRSGRERRLPSKLLDSDTSSRVYLNPSDRISSQPPSNSSPLIVSLPLISKSSNLEPGSHSNCRVNRLSSQAVSKVVQFVQKRTDNLKRKWCESELSVGCGEPSPSKPIGPSRRRKKRRKRALTKEPVVPDISYRHDYAFHSLNWGDIRIPVFRPLAESSSQNSDFSSNSAAVSCSSGSESDIIFPMMFLEQQKRRPLSSSKVLMLYRTLDEELALQMKRGSFIPGSERSSSSSIHCEGDSVVLDTLLRDEQTTTGPPRTIPGIAFGASGEALPSYHRRVSSDISSIPAGKNTLILPHNANTFVDDSLASSGGAIHLVQTMSNTVKGTDLSTDEDRMVVSGTEAIDQDISSAPLPKRTSFQFRDSCSSSESEECGPGSADYLVKSTEPVKQNSLPLRLRIRNRVVAREPQIGPRTGADARRGPGSTTADAPPSICVPLRLPLKKSAEGDCPRRHFVYSWNMMTSEKSSSSMLLSALVHLCAKDSNIFLYHGQDTDAWKPLSKGKDIVHWSNNDLMMRRSRKVRVLNMQSSKIIPFKEAPSLETLDSVLQDEKFRVFSEHALNVAYERSAHRAQTRSPDFCGLVSSFKPLPGEWLKSFITHKVILPLRCLGRPEDVFKGESRPILWNKSSRTFVRSDRGPQKEALSSTLIRPSRYEIYFGQDILIELGDTRHQQLVPVSANAPAHLPAYWDKRKKNLNAGGNFSKTDTVESVLMNNKHLELYTGQNITRKRDNFEELSYFSVIQRAIERYKRSGLGMFEQYFTLAYRGEKVTELVRQGWIPKTLPLNSTLSESMVFWDLRNQQWVCPGDNHDCVLDEFLERYKSKYKVYIGQDLSNDVLLELHEWFKVLKWRPGCRGRFFVPMLLKEKPCVPLKTSQKRVRDKEKTHVVDVSTSRISKRGRLSHVASDKPVRKERTKPATEPVVDSIGELEKPRDVTAPKPKPVSAVESDDEDNLPTEKFQGFLLSKKRASEIQKLQNDSHVLVRHKPSGLVLLPGQSPVLEDLAKFLNANSEYEIFDQYARRSEQEKPIASESLDASEDFVRAKLAGQREANHLQYVVSGILHTTCVGDSLQKVKEALEEELSTCGKFADLLEKLRSAKFVSLGSILLAKLEDLDVYNLLTECHINGQGTRDLFSLREDMLLGVSFLVHDLIHGFREICCSALQYNAVGSVIYEDIVVLYNQGEQVIASFFANNLETMREDLALFNIRKIWAEAKKLMEAMKGAKSKSLESLLAEMLSAPRKISQRNPYLNHRDGAGHSHMGKPQSSRVLGLLIADDQSCLTDIGREHWVSDTKCHLCSKEVCDVYSNSLVCANRLYRKCQRIVCRECLFRTQNLNKHTFLAVRASGTWKCVHCTGVCKKQKRACSKNDKNVPRNRVREMTFVFRSAELKNGVEMTARFARCKDNGFFESFETGKCPKKALVQCSDGDAWRCLVTLGIGVYRVQIESNGRWFASSILHVLPVRRGEEGRQRGAPENMGEVSTTRVSLREYMRRPIVEWQEGSSTGVGNVMSLRSSSIRESSRTDGYNWTSAKRHQIKRWRPKINGHVPPQLPTIITTNVEPFVPEEEHAESMAVCGGVSGLFSLFMVKQKKSYTEFSKELTAIKFEKMTNESLWGLVVCRSTIHGSGLFTVSGYGTGDYIVEYAGELIRTPLGDLREKQYEAVGLGTYLFTLNDSHIVDATVRSNRARFVNHCCDPNMKSRIISVRGRDLIVLVAIRPIPPFSELTMDYMLPIENKKLQCQCKSWNCTGVMN